MVGKLSRDEYTQQKMEVLTALRKLGEKVNKMSSGGAGKKKTLVEYGQIKKKCIEVIEVGILQ